MLSHVQSQFNFLKSRKPMFTIKSLVTGNHFSYQLKHPKRQGGDHLLTMSYIFSHPISGGHRKYLGYVNWEGEQVSAGMSGDDRDPAFIALAWYLRYLWSLKIAPHSAQLIHSGKCGRCGRELTDPRSIETGLGPECRKATK